MPPTRRRRLAGKCAAASTTSRSPFTPVKSGPNRGRSPPIADDWDPRCRDSEGRFWIAWTSYREDDYDVFLKCATSPTRKNVY